MDLTKVKLGIYPGSFNPWHKGHTDVLLKALGVFDIVVILQMVNPEKQLEPKILPRDIIPEEFRSRVSIKVSGETLVETVSHRFYIHGAKLEPTAIIRGLRNGTDLQYEMNQQYWNEDLGIKIPYVYFITDRALAHVSSSGIRNVEKLGLKHNY